MAMNDLAQRAFSGTVFLTMKFLITYLLMAVLGTIGVYYGTCPLWQAMGWPLPAATHSAVAAPVPTVSYARPMLPTEAPSIVSTPAQQPLPVQKQFDSTPSVVPPPATKPDLATAEPKASEAPVPASTPPATTSGALPPLTQGSKSWGLTLTCAAYYSLSGANRGQLPGGAIMDIEDSRNTSKGDMSMGRVERDNAMLGPYLVANVDLVRFNVARSEVPPETIAILKQYYGLKGKMDQRVADLKKQAASINPYAAAYGAAVKKYNDFGEREKQLTAQRDAASGAERMRLVDQLRGMLPESQKLLRTVEAAKTQYNGWKTAHPNATAVDPAGDAQVQELQKQIAALEPQVKDFVK